MMTTTRPISNSDDIIDSRDVIERLEELASQYQDHANGGDSEPLDDEERAELDALSTLADEGETLADWIYGVALIRDSYFVDYARDYAEDVVEGMRDAQWPFSHIDWEAAADELQTDYTNIEFNGVTYWARA